MKAREERKNLDRLWVAIQDPAVPNEAILEQVQVGLLKLDRLNTQGLCVLDMLGITPHRATLWKELVFDPTDFSSQILRRILFVYTPEHFFAIAERQTDQYCEALAQEMIECRHTRAAVLFNLLGPEKLNALLCALKQESLLAMVERVDPNRLEESEILPNCWQSLFLECHPEILSVVMDKIPPQETLWITRALVDALAENQTDASNQEPTWMNPEYYRKNVWLYYRNHLLPQQLYQDDARSRVVKLYLINHYCSDEQIQMLVKDADDAGTTPLVKAMQKGQLVLARGLVGLFGAELITPAIIEQTIETRRYEALANLLYGLDEMSVCKTLCTATAYNAHQYPLLDIMSRRLANDKAMPENVYDQAYRHQHVGRYRRTLTHFGTAFDHVRSEACQDWLKVRNVELSVVIRKLTKDLCHSRRYDGLDVMTDSLNIEHFQKSLKSLRRFSSVTTIKQVLNRLYNARWCTIYHFNAIVSHLESWFGKSDDWLFIIKDARSYAQVKLQEELKYCAHDRAQLVTDYGDKADGIILMRKKLLLEWISQETLCTHGTNIVSRLFFSPVGLQKFVRDQLEATKQVPDKDELYYLCDTQFSNT